LQQDKNEPQPTQESDVLKSEHLTEGFRPIMACVGSEEEYGDEIKKLKDLEIVSHDIDFEANPSSLKEKGFKSAGHKSYVISPIDERPKFTKHLFDCTALIVVGREIGTQTELSFLTHQNPKEFLYFQKKAFVKHLTERLKELKEKCSEGSIDVVIAGGNLREDALVYQQSLQILDSVVQETCGFEPLVISGPKEAQGSDKIYFDTQTRRAYIVRPDTDHYKDVFKPSEVGEMKEKWRDEKRRIRKERERREIEENK